MVLPYVIAAGVGALIGIGLKELFGEREMYNCHEDMLAYHNDKVTLPDSERREMKNRRNANRDRLKDGLKRDGEPSPLEIKSQGSYAMRTMVQHPANDYDIDDGVYFDKEALKGAKGGDRTPADAKEMVRKALHDDKFKTAPEVRTNCVRVYYDAGYHIDVPVYRRVTKKNFFGEEETFDELAGSEWKRSNPLAVTDWFNKENKNQSPNLDNGGQLRRSTRLLKKFARSRNSWASRIASGFMITKLVTEKYAPNENREDRALYDTMVAIRDRLNSSLQVKHPTVDGEMLTTGPDDAKAKYLRDRLDWAIGELAVLFDSGCTREQALKAWDGVFSTDFFVSRLEKSTEKSAAAAVNHATGATVSILSGALPAAAREPDRPVDKRGGNRYA